MFFNTKEIGHFLVEKSLALAVGPDPFAVNDELRDGTLAGLPQDLFGGTGGGLNVDLLERDVVLLQEALWRCGSRSTRRRYRPGVPSSQGLNPGRIWQDYGGGNLRRVWVNSTRRPMTHTSPTLVGAGPSPGGPEFVTRSGFSLHLNCFEQTEVWVAKLEMAWR